MSSRVLSIGIAPQERARLCMAASEDVCLQAAHHVQRAAQISNEDPEAAPYVRAVYVYQASAIAAERVTMASGEECGSYLRDILHTCATEVASPSVTCWLTVMLEDTCVVQHAVFAMSTKSPQPQNWTSAIAAQPDGCPFQPGVARWSLSTRPAPLRATPVGNVHTPLDEALAASDSVPAAREVAPPTEQALPTPPPHQQSQGQASAPAQTPAQEPQDAPPAIARSFGTTPCAHSSRALAKAMAATKRPPSPPAQERTPLPSPQQSDMPEQADGEDQAEAQPHFARVPAQHEHSYPQSSAQSSSAPKRSTAGPAPTSSVYEKVERYQVDAVPHLAPRRHHAQREREQPPPSEPNSAAGQRPARSHTTPKESAVPSMDDSRKGAPHHATDGLLVLDSPQADLVMPSNGRQWGDLAYRTRYSPRREELWDIANGVMTHNYAQAAIGPGGEPAYIEDYHEEEEEDA